MLFTARSTLTASYFRPRPVLPPPSSEMSSLVRRPRRHVREGGRRDSFLASFHPLSTSGQGEARRSAAANYLSLGLPRLALSGRFGSVPFLSHLERKATYQASMHSIHVPSSSLFLRSVLRISKYTHILLTGNRVSACPIARLH